jgi:hypothetical protein
LSSLPAPALPHLELQLDSGHKGVETDLYKIADHMLNWEEELSAPMRLAAADISDIKDKHPFKPKLQRYVIPIALNNYYTLYTLISE